MTSRQLPIRRTLAAVFVLGLIVWCAAVIYWGSRLKIGRETTFVTGPMTSNGRIDYAAALHQRLSAGVKPEDNAAILIDQAFGPAAISPELRLRYFDWIATDPLPEQGDYVIPQAAFIQQKLKAANAPSDLNDSLDKEFQRSHERPWTRSDCPMVAEWLDANAKPLELIERASRRSHYYSPLVTNEGLTQGALESTVNNLREAARLLVARARLRLSDDDVPGAWSDLLACHRLARMASQRAPGTIAYLIAVALESVASRGDETLVAHGLSAEQARKCLDDHARLAPFGSLIDLIDFQERLMVLDGMIRLDDPISHLFVNTLLRRTNVVFNDFVTALKRETYGRRIQGSTAVEAELKQRTAPSKKVVQQTVKQLMNPGEAFGDVLLGLLSPAIVQPVTAETRIRVRHGLVQIGFALAAYHAEHASYPLTLDELVPQYLATIPNDNYTGKPLAYVPRENGFVVYSFGANGHDDGGRMTRGTDADDVSFEIPQRFDE